MTSGKYRMIVLHRVKTAEPKVKGNLKKWYASVLKDRNNDKTLLRNFVSSIHNSQ